MGPKPPSFLTISQVLVAEVGGRNKLNAARQSTVALLSIHLVIIEIHGTLSAFCRDAISAMFAHDSKRSKVDYNRW